MKNKRTINYIAMILIICGLFIYFSVSSEARGADRYDGVWLFPLDPAGYDYFSDWNGCPGYGLCTLCNTYHGESIGDPEHTFQGNATEKGHNGIDVAYGGNVYAMAPGRVCYVNSNITDVRGCYIIIEHEIPNSSYSYYSVYQHLGRISVSTGSIVEVAPKTTIIGTVGDTGGSSGHDYGLHLHYEIVIAPSGGLDGNSLYNVERNQWILYKNQNISSGGRILVNPTNSSFSYMRGNGYSTEGFTLHPGSIEYTFNPNEVKIGNGTGDKSTFKHNIELVQGGNGTVSVVGWIIDDSKPTESIFIHVYIGGESSYNGEGYQVYCDVERNDVAAAYPGTGKNHGFSGTISTSKRGRQPVYIFAINGTTNPCIWSGTVEIGEPVVCIDHSFTKYVSNNDGTHKIVCSKCDAEDPNHLKDQCVSNTSNENEDHKCKYCDYLISQGLPTNEVTEYPYYYFKCSNCGHKSPWYGAGYCFTGRGGCGGNIELSSGYVFWSESSWNKCTEYGNGKYYNAEVDAFKYEDAQPRIKEVTVKYVSEGNQIDSVQVKKNQVIPSHSDPTAPTGYKFVGWYKENSFVNKITFGASRAYDDMTLYAKFEKAIVSLSNFSLNSYSEDLEIGETFQLSVTSYEPENTTSEKNATWSSSANAIATVDNNGLITGKSKGRTTITCTIDGISKQCNVNVDYPSYTINYELNDGINSESNVTSYKQDQEVTLYNPTKEHYTFEGWYRNSDLTDGPYTTIKAGTTGDIVLYAKWSSAKHKVIFKYTTNTAPDGSKITKLNPVEFSESDGVQTLPSHKPVGTFYLKWYSDSEGTSEVTSIPAGTDSDVTVYGIWKNQASTIKFNKGNVKVGEIAGTMKNQEIVAEDSRFNLTKCAYTVKGYAFAHWIDENGNTYGDKMSCETVKVDVGATLYLTAVWKPVSYTITYKNITGVEDNTNPATYNINCDSFMLINVSRPGSQFVGWYLDSDYRKPISMISAGSTGNKVVYAKWINNKYSIAFNGNGKTSGTLASIKNVSCGKTVQLPSNTFKRTGYKFVGWNTESDGSGTSYSNKAKVFTLTSVDKAVVTLYAHWEPVVYTITYKNVINEVASEINSTYTIESDAIVLPIPEQAGCEFIGWYSDSNFKKVITQIKAGSTGNKVIYAKWKANKYSVAFDANGGTGKMSKQTKLSCGKYYSLTANAFKMKGYTFVGWNTETDGSGTQYTNKAKVVTLSAEDGAVVTLYAQWKVTNYKITYKNVTSDTVNGNVTTFTMYDSVVFVAPTRVGYDFVGWYSDSSCTKKITEIKEGTTSNKTVYAKWKAHKYSVKFDGNSQEKGTLKGSTKALSGKAYGSTFALTTNGYSLSGYSFLGWSLDQNATTATYKNGAKVKNLSSENGDVVVLYAVWKKK